MGAESGKTLQKWTKEQVYDRITFLYVKEWKNMRLIDADKLGFSEVEIWTD